MDFGPFRATPSWPCHQGLQQNSECVPAVLVHRAHYLWQFRESSSKNLRGVVWQSKKGPKILLFDLWWPPYIPLGQMFAPQYSIFITSVWYVTWLCLYKMDFGPFGATPSCISLGVSINKSLTDDIVIFEQLSPGLQSPMTAFAQPNGQMFSSSVWYASDWWSGGCGFHSCRARQHSLLEIDHIIFSTVIFSLLLIQEGQVSFWGKKVHKYRLTT